MIFLRDDGHDEPDRPPKLALSAAPSTKSLFNTNERFSESAIAVAHSKETTVFLFDTAELTQRSASAVTHSKSTTSQISIRYKWKLHNKRPLTKKIANSALRTPRA